MLLTFQELWSRLSNGDESTLIEAKRGSEVGKSIFETISAFANEPDAGGGYLLLGVVAKVNSLFPDYEIQGVTNADKIQCDIATQCRECFSVPIRPEIMLEVVNGKTVVVAHVPEANCHDKPVFVKSRGMANGSFRRIGSTDQLCTDDDIALFYQGRGQKSFDENAIDGTSFDDVDSRALAAYRAARSQSQSDGSLELLQYSDRELLFALNATEARAEDARLTLSGVVLFGKPESLRRLLPMTRVDYIRVDGREWVPDPDKRYQTIEKLGPLLITIPQLINQILDDIPKTFSLGASGVHRQDVPLIPKAVIREAVVNALMHRSYRSSQPVQIIRYANRIEIKNPGYSLIPEERLGEPGSKSRNPKIAATLHDAGLAETKGTGIRVMRDSMARANLTLPLIESDRKRDEFTLRLLVHHLLGDEDLHWLAQFKDCRLIPDDAKALIVLREIGSLDNAAYRSINHVDSLTASGRLRRLRDSGLLEQVGKGATTHYLPGPRIHGKLKTSPRKRTTQSPLRKDLPEPLRRELDVLRRELPEALASDLEALGRRASQNDLNEMIHRLCSWKPLSLRQLSLLVGRDEEHLRNRNMKRLLAENRLGYWHKDRASHPDQKYVPVD